MKKFLPLIILLNLSLLFYWISARSYALQSSPLESIELFRLFRGIRKIMALLVPIVLFVFYMLTSGLIFTLLDERFNSQKTAIAISFSIRPVILNCLIYLIILYGIGGGDTMQEMLNQQSSLGLVLADMEQVSVIIWGGFYEFFALLIRHQYGISIGKAVGITLIPTLLVVGGRYLFGLF